MFGFVFLETICVTLARDEDEPEEEAEAKECEEPLEGHYSAGHFVLFTALSLMCFVELIILILRFW